MSAFFSVCHQDCTEQAVTAERRPMIAKALARAASTTAVEFSIRARLSVRRTAYANWSDCRGLLVRRVWQAIGSQVVHDTIAEW